MHVNHICFETKNRFPKITEGQKRSRVLIVLVLQKGTLSWCKKYKKDKNNNYLSDEKHCLLYCGRIN